MNKALWSGSYALFGLGTASLAFSLCYVLVDLPASRPRWVTPLEWLGRHALAIYVASEFLTHALDYPWIPRGTTTVSLKDAIFWRELAPMVGDAGAMRSSVIYAATYALCWITVAVLLQVRQQTMKRA
jgi:predicted acyltransferase